MANAGRAIYLVVSTGAMAKDANTGEFTVPQMDRIRQLSRDFSGYVRVGFDETGTSSASTDDEGTWALLTKNTGDYFQQTGAAQRQVFAKIKELLVKTVWYKTYVGMIKGQLKTLSQNDDVSTIVAVCLPGGPITEVEQNTMQEIISEAQADMQKQGIPSKQIVMQQHTSVESLREHVIRESSKMSPAATSVANTLASWIGNNTPDEVKARVLLWVLSSAIECVEEFFEAELLEDFVKELQLKKVQENRFRKQADKYEKENATNELDVKRKADRKNSNARAFSTLKATAEHAGKQAGETEKVETERSCKQADESMLKQVQADETKKGEAEQVCKQEDESVLKQVLQLFSTGEVRLALREKIAQTIKFEGILTDDEFVEYIQDLINEGSSTYEQLIKTNYLMTSTEIRRFEKIIGPRLQTPPNHLVPAGAAVQAVRHLASASDQQKEATIDSQAQSGEQAPEMSADAWYELGNKKGGTVEGKTYTQAQCFEQALKLDATRAKAWERLGAHCKGGTVEGKTYSEAECCIKAVELAPTRNRWTNLGLRGGGKVNGKDYSQAQCFEEALKLDATYADAWQGLSAVRQGGTVKDKTYSQAECCIKAVELEPTSKRWENLGTVGGGNVNGKDYSKAQCYEEALKLDATDANAWQRLAYHGKGGTVAGKTYSEAECFIKAVELAPTGMRWENLGTVGGGKVNGKDYSKVQCYEEALKLDATDAYVWNSLGRHGKGGTVAGKTYSEVECYIKAVELEPTSKRWKNLGNVGGGKVNGKEYSKEECYENAEKC